MINKTNKIKPFIKWPGGKEREIKLFSKYLPTNINNYIEPFLGGGAVYFWYSDKKVKGKYYINDLSEDLIYLYKLIKNQNPVFLATLESINSNYEYLKSQDKVNYDSFIEELTSYREDNKSLDDIYVKHNKLKLRGELCSANDVFVKEYNKMIKKKIIASSKILDNNRKARYKDTFGIYQTAILSALYNTIRYINNYYDQYTKEQKSAFYYYLRQFCYSSMFRYNADGKFNVPYGGMSYNEKSITKIIEQITNKDLTNFLNRKTIIKKLDFEKFINTINHTKDDFMFVDPPYHFEGTGFSRYANNDFTEIDHIRLANCLANLNCKIMLVIKRTNFIYNLYRDKGFRIMSFDKNYLVNFQNRNDQRAEHLIITNYKLEDNI